MNKRNVTILCNIIALVCWGILLYAGIYEGKPKNIVLYGLCFVFTLISLIKNITGIKLFK